MTKLLLKLTMWSIATSSSTVFNVWVVWIWYAPSKQRTDVSKTKQTTTTKTKTHTPWTWNQHITDLIPLSQQDGHYDMPEDHKQDSTKSSSFRSPLWPPSHRWHSHVPPSPTQTPSAAFLFSATVQNRFRNNYHSDKLWLKGQNGWGLKHNES